MVQTLDNAPHHLVVPPKEEVRCLYRSTCQIAEEDGCLILKTDAELAIRRHENRVACVRGNPCTTHIGAAPMAPATIRAKFEIAKRPFLTAGTSGTFFLLQHLVFTQHLDDAEVGRLNEALDVPTLLSALVPRLGSLLARTNVRDLLVYSGPLCRNQDILVHALLTLLREEPLHSSSNGGGATLRPPSNK